MTQVRSNLVDLRPFALQSLGFGTAVGVVFGLVAGLLSNDFLSYAVGTLAFVVVAFVLLISITAVRASLWNRDVLIVVDADALEISYGPRVVASIPTAEVSKVLFGSPMTVWSWFDPTAFFLPRWPQLTVWGHASDWKPLFESRGLVMWGSAACTSAAREIGQALGQAGGSSAD